MVKSRYIEKKENKLRKFTIKEKIAIADDWIKAMERINQRTRKNERRFS